MTGRDGKAAAIAPYNGGDLFKGTPLNSLCIQHLRSKRIMVLGLGPVGASVGLGLAKSGVGEIIAVDPDVLEVQDCMHHVLGTGYLGWPKPDALAQYLKEQVPSVECTPVGDDEFQDGPEALNRLIGDSNPLSTTSYGLICASCPPSRNT
jgi:tRNA A37 threonylcarbamoyladenosine dehydratase